MAIYEKRLMDDRARIMAAAEAFGREVKGALESALESFLTGNRVLANQTILQDHAINRQAVDIGKLCHAFIALHMPSAGHLRSVSSIIAMASELERIGDYACTISQEALNVSAPPSGDLDGVFNRLVLRTRSTMDQALCAFAKEELETARKTIKEAGLAREDLDEAVGVLMHMGKKSEKKTRNLIGYFSVLNALERICMQAQNICEEILFIKTGAIAVEESKFYILFVDGQGGGLSKLAQAIGRKFHDGHAKFMSAGVPSVGSLCPQLKAFSQERGLALEKPTGLDDLDLNPAMLDVIVGLGESAEPYFVPQPYHAAILNWEGPADPSNVDAVYQELAVRIHELMEILAGDGAGK